MITISPTGTVARCFNTASGMDCMQYVDLELIDVAGKVSIPQAVWIACNLVKKGDVLIAD